MQSILKWIKIIQKILKIHYKVFYVGPLLGYCAGAEYCQWKESLYKLTWTDNNPFTLVAWVKWRVSINYVSS